MRGAKSDVSFSEKTSIPLNRKNFWLEAENNYKDTATEAYRKFCHRLEELERTGVVKGKMLDFYRDQQKELGEMMKGFHH